VRRSCKSVVNLFQRKPRCDSTKSFSTRFVARQNDPGKDLTSNVKKTKFSAVVAIAIFTFDFVLSGILGVHHFCWKTAFIAILAKNIVSSGAREQSRFTLERFASIPSKPGDSPDGKTLMAVRRPHMFEGSPGLIILCQVLYQSSFSSVMTGRGKGGGEVGKGGANHHKKMLCDNIRGITNLANRRLAHRGSVKRISGLIYEETRGALKVFPVNVVHDVVIYPEHVKSKTVIALDVVYALKRKGHAP